MESLKLREQFVQGLNGTTMSEVVLISFQLPLVIFVTVFVELCLHFKKVSKLGIFNTGYTTIFIIEFIIIVLPIMLMCTLWSDILLFIIFFLIMMITIIIIYLVSSPNMHVLYWREPKLEKVFLSDQEIPGKQPFVTYFRSLVFMTTAISIMGVDFHVYPRRFAKTETYGVSLMDLGVGLFVISSSFVSKKSNKTFFGGLQKTLLESFVFSFLGGLRYFLIQRYEYQTHLSEYGVHWNFFFTLAFVKVLSFVLLSISRGHSLVCGLAILFLHQYLLSYSLEDFVIGKKERNNFLSANREGIVSLFGYLNLYLIGISLQSVMTSSYEKQTTKKKCKTLVWFFLLTLFFGFVSYYLDSTFCPISRRLANMSYVTWVLTVSLLVLSICLLVELMSVYFLPIHSPTTDQIYHLITPAILDSVNVNGLFFFLTSNLFTGLINLFIDTYNTKALSSMFILCMYMLVNCGIVFQLYVRKIQVRFW